MIAIDTTTKITTAMTAGTTGEEPPGAVSSPLTCGALLSVPDELPSFLPLSPPLSVRFTNIRCLQEYENLLVRSGCITHHKPGFLRRNIQDVDLDSLGIGTGTMGTKIARISGHLHEESKTRRE